MKIVILTRKQEKVLKDLLDNRMKYGNIYKIEEKGAFNGADSCKLAAEDRQRLGQEIPNSIFDEWQRYLDKALSAGRDVELNDAIIKILKALV